MTDTEEKYCLAWFVAATLISALITGLAINSCNQTTVGPVRRVYDKKVLIACPDGSTQWAPLPQCKEVK